MCKETKGSTFLFLMFVTRYWVYMFCHVKDILILLGWGSSITFSSLLSRKSSIMEGGIGWFCQYKVKHADDDGDYVLTAITIKITTIKVMGATCKAKAKNSQDWLQVQVQDQDKDKGQEETKLDQKRPNGAICIVLGPREPLVLPWIGVSARPPARISPPSSSFPSSPPSIPSPLVNLVTLTPVTQVTPPSP